MSCVTSAQLQSPQAMNAATGTTLFEVGAKPRCSRFQSSRGRPQQCARAAARTSSSRKLDSRGSSAARSRSSTRSRRPSAEVELRREVESQTSGVCSTSFIRSLLTDVTDELVTEFDYHTDEECVSSPSNVISRPVAAAENVLSAAAPAITEEDAEEEDDGFKVQEFMLSDSLECSDCNDELDDNEDDCDFDDDVCSLGSDDAGEILVAAQLAKNAVSDDVIREAFEEAGEFIEVAAELPCTECDAIDEYVEVDFLGEASPCRDDLAFDFASTILDGAFEQAATSWQHQENCQACETPAVAEVEETEKVELADLKQKAREALLKVARAKTPSQEEESDQLKSKVQKALFDGVQNGGLSKAIAQSMPSSSNVVERKGNDVSIEQKIRQALSKGVSTGELSKGFEKALQKDKWDALRSKVNDSLRTATKSGIFTRALGRVMRKTEPWECLREKVQKGLTQSVNAGNLQEVVMQAMDTHRPTEAATSSVPRSLHTARSRRRIIGGVVRTPAVHDTLEEVQPPTTTRKASSRQRLAADCAKASMSAMAMDLTEGQFSGSQAWTRQSMSRNGLRTPFQISSSHYSLTAAPLKTNEKMRSSASLGSLAPVKVCKASAGGFLPVLAPERTSAETIAWSMQVSKTTSKWSNTGLRGSKSMIF